MEIISRVILSFFIITVKIYQNSISKLFPSRCRFYPSCSNYMIMAIEKYRFKGILMGLKRILSCHPFNVGGIDEVK